MVAAAAPSVHAKSDRHVIAFLAFTGSLIALGIDIALPAFDEMRPDLGLDPSSPRITQLITVYFFGMAAGQLVWGPIADHFGRVKTMYAGVGLYVLAAICAAFAPNLTTMLIVRAIWGLGAAAPAGMRASIARDLYTGDQMARIMSLMMAIFMVGPIAAPLLGEVILYVASWPFIFLFCAVAGLAQMFWTSRFGETLPTEDRLPLEFAPTIAAFRRVLKTRAAVGHTLAYGFAAASFFVFLSSTQPIMDRLYGRADQFAVVFAATGVVQAAAFVATNTLVARIGARTAIRWSSVAGLVMAIVALALVVSSDGLPSFWLWILPVLAINIAATPIGPVSITLALEPLGEIAGTASGVVGFLSLLIGSALAAVIDAQIVDDVMPMAVGSVVFFVLAVVATRWAQAGQPASAGPNVAP